MPIERKMREINEYGRKETLQKHGFLLSLFYILRILYTPAAYQPQKDGDHCDYQEYVNNVANTEYKCSQ
jgi:hypothetical protein